VIRIVVYALITPVAIVAAFLTEGQAQNLYVGLATAFLVPLVEQTIRSRTELRLLWYSLRYRSERVRVSYSYLYRIQLGGEYLLIEGKRFPQYQPVGGVYKTLPSGSGALTTFAATQDDLVPIDPTSENDLRVRMPGKELLTFYTWLNGGTGRETAPWREFYEELVMPSILQPTDFPYIYHRYLGRTVRPMRYSPQASSRELLIADVYELLPTSAQNTALTDLKTQGHPAVRWASEGEIRRLGVTPGVSAGMPIAEPAVWTLDIKT